MHLITVDSIKAAVTEDIQTRGKYPLTYELNGCEVSFISIQSRVRKFHLPRKVDHKRKGHLLMIHNSSPRVIQMNPLQLFDFGAGSCTRW